jgi:serine protease Do
MKSNVLIQTPADLGRLRGEGIGSGVVVHIKENTAWIVTNRHVVDASFTEDRDGGASATLPAVKLLVKAIGQPTTPAQLVWIAPHGIDLALVTMPVTSREIMAAVWDAQPRLTVGESVFAVGNPHGLGWTHTSGGLSQMRLQARGQHEVRIIQTSAAINPGNSGGGLYDSQGHLLGINTWTKDKRFAEGLSFSIAFHTLLPLLPAHFQLPASQTEADVP